MITEGGISPLDKALIVRGGVQGLPRTPTDWTMVMKVILDFAQVKGGPGYKLRTELAGQTTRTTILHDIAYGDDLVPRDSSKEGAMLTASRSAAMMTVFNIRSQGAKSIHHPSEQTFRKKLSQLRARPLADTSTREPLPSPCPGIVIPDGSDEVATRNSHNWTHYTTKRSGQPKPSPSNSFRNNPSNLASATRQRHPQNKTSSSPKLLNYSDRNSPRGTSYWTPDMSPANTGRQHDTLRQHSKEPEEDSLPAVS